ncbi:MAG: Holliday junction resolvase RuvX [Bacteroidota bacterium]
MPRVIGIDYGLKRTGIAVTDPLQIIASPLATIPTKELLTFLKKYFQDEEVEALAIGMPKDLNNRDTHSTENVRKLIEKIKKVFPALKIVEIDERFTSKIAFSAMVEGGLKKKDRKDKATVDKLSATIILQSYLQSTSSL